MSVGLTDEDLANVEDMKLLAWTYPWWRRPFTWLLWHLPVVKWIAGMMFKVNPYRRVVAILRLTPRMIRGGTDRGEKRRVGKH